MPLLLVWAVILLDTIVTARSLIEISLLTVTLRGRSTLQGTNHVRILLAVLSTWHTGMVSFEFIDALELLVSS